MNRTLRLCASTFLLAALTGVAEARFPESAFCHNGKGGNVLDVTKPPFNAKGDGVTDDTAALCAALRFVRDNQYQAGTNGLGLWCARWDNHWVVYLPQGIYRVSDTVCQGWPALAQSRKGKFTHMKHIRVNSLEHEKELGDAMYDEINWQLRIIGESREKTVITLADRAKGYDNPSKPKPVLANLMLAIGSADNPGNFVENLTIDTGKGNPGAVALRWNGSNHGALRDLKLTSGDGTGAVGLLMDAWNATGHGRNISIEGFDTGIKLAAGRETLMAMEHITITANRIGAEVGSHVETVGGNEKGGCDPLGAIDFNVAAPLPIRVTRDGVVAFISGNVKSTTGGKAVEVGEDGMFKDMRGESRASTPCEPPHVDCGTSSDWAIVDDFGAKGDGVTDDTAAVQRAMDSGKSVVWFTKMIYRIDGTVNVPARVRLVTASYSTVYRAKMGESAKNTANTKDIVKNDPPGMFAITERADAPLVFKRFRSAGAVFADHRADRVLALEDVYVVEHHWRSNLADDNAFMPLGANMETKLWRCWRNATPEGPRKTLFLTECGMATADLGNPGEGFENVDCWARMLNTEHVRVADGPHAGKGACFSAKQANVWIFGFKSEASDTLIKAADHSKVDVVLGTYLRWSPNEYPLCVSEASALSALVTFWQYDCFTSPALVKDSKVVVSMSDVPKLKSANCGILDLAAGNPSKLQNRQ